MVNNERLLYDDDAGMPVTFVTHAEAEQQSQSEVLSPNKGVPILLEIVLKVLNQ